MDITLVKTRVSDLDTLFLFQLDKEANDLAAFTTKDPSNKEAYITKYTKLVNDPKIHNKTIYLDNKIVGSIAKFEMEGQAELTYWIDKNHWGKGIATKALTEFLKIETSRPIYGRAASDNIGSRKVLEKCGFKSIGTDKGFANARGKKIEETIYKLV